MTDNKQTAPITPELELDNPITEAPLSNGPSEPASASVQSADDLFLSKQSDEQESNSNLPKTNKPVADIAEIQGMPKEFRDYHPIAGGHGKTAGLLIMVVSFIFLIAVSVGVYFYIFKPYLLESGKQLAQNGQLSDIAKEIKIDEGLNEIIPGLNQTETDKNTDTPQQVYNKYMLAMVGASSFESYYNAIMLYGSQYKIEQAEAEKLRFEAPNSQDIVVEFLKQQMPNLIGNEKVTEQVLAGQATVLISSTDNDFLGSIELIKENEQWKINNIFWKDATESTTEEINEDMDMQYLKAEDRDNDGLTDLEENLLDANKENADSDNDGYSDASEVLNLYNPAGNDKLIDSPRMSSYLNEIFDYSIIYPSQWSKEVRDNRESVIFRADDDSIIQVLSILNPQQLSIDAWYKQNFNLDKIDNNLVVNSDNWQGIKTANGLYIYIQSLDANEIFVLQYVPGGATLDYVNIFQAMINSFVIK